MFALLEPLRADVQKGGRKPMLDWRTGRQVEPEHLKLLVVEDERADARMIERTLRAMAGFSVEIKVVHTADAALAAMQEHRFDVALLDFYLNSDCGADLVPEIVARQPRCAPILLTGQLTPTTHHYAIHCGAMASLCKNKLDPWQLETTIRHAVLACAGNRVRSAPQASVPESETDAAAYHAALSRHLEAALGTLLKSAERCQQSLAEGQVALAAGSLRKLRYLADDLQTFFVDSLEVGEGRSGAAAAKRSTCDLQSMLVDAAHILEPHCRERGVTLDITYQGSPVLIDAPESGVRRALTDFLAGCLSLARDGGALQVRIRYLTQPDRIAVVVQCATGVRESEGARRAFDDLTSRARAILARFKAGARVDCDTSGSATIARLVMPPDPVAGRQRRAS